MQYGFGLGMLSPRVVNPPTHSKIHSLSALHHLQFEAEFLKKDLSVTFDLMINSSHIPISVAINDSLTQNGSLKNSDQS